MIVDLVQYTSLILDYSQFAEDHFSLQPQLYWASQIYTRQKLPCARFAWSSQFDVTKCMEQDPSLKPNSGSSGQDIGVFLWNPKVLSITLKTSTPETHKPSSCSHLRQSVSSCLLPSSFSFKILYLFHVSAMRTTYPSHRNPLEDTVCPKRLVVG